jgi:hypothetical protein
MSALTLHFLRRVSGLALVVALALTVWWRGSAALGIDAPEQVAAAQAALSVAREYGASEAQPTFAAALQKLASAEARLREGDRRQARRLAMSAQESALEAQRASIVEKEGLRTRSEEIAAELDREMNALEHLYGDTVKTVSRDRAAQMLTRMKQARATGAALILAHEQGNYRKVVEGEPAARSFLAETRARFEAAGPT